MLGLIPSPTVSLVGLPIVKVPGGQKIISILIEATVWLVGVPSTTSEWLRGDRSKIIAHHKGVVSIVLGAIYILDHEAFFIRTRNRLPIFIPLVV